ncbi:MAG: glyceraldehyde-3-phosphate dehydrogenase [Gammaproteobacteria bacterium]|nr:glyceraldehyde-3-phosphate dehydrogenase [Gammaproteobacteria bacterium]
MRIGLMGLGHVGRQIYGLALAQPDCEVVAVSDIGQPGILHHLLAKTLPKGTSVRLVGNYLEGKVDGKADPVAQTRLMAAERPEEIPWDLLGVDLVIDATGRFRSAEELAPHLDNGARRVLLSGLPEGDVDRVVLGGVNDGEAQSEDRIVSAGSASTTALALALKVLVDERPIVHATMTTVHAYTGDMSLQDHAASDYRRSRSGARNIIPNDTLAPNWVECALPAVRGKLSGFALNVPVGEGSLMDLTVAYREPAPERDVVNGLFAAAARRDPRRLAVTDDPVVSSDVLGSTESILVDMQGTLRSGGRLVKVLGWHESLGHARSILDLARLYAGLDSAAASG